MHIIPAIRIRCAYSWPLKARSVVSACKKKKSFFPSHIIIILYIYNMLLDDCSSLLCARVLYVVLYNIITIMCRYMCSHCNIVDATNHRRLFRKSVMDSKRAAHYNDNVLIYVYTYIYMLQK